MIFVTVGHQMPFDRLVSAVDAWAGSGPRREVFAQIGETSLRPAHLRWAAKIDPAEFQRLVRDCQIVVGHAGMGTILTALEFAKPVLVMPRRSALRETRNDHQLATARSLIGRPGIHVAEDEDALCASLDGLSRLRGGDPIPPTASEDLLEAVREFVFGHASARGSGRRHSDDRTILRVR